MPNDEHDDTPSIDATADALGKCDAWSTELAELYDAAAYCFMEADPPHSLHDVLTAARDGYRYGIEWKANHA